MSKILTTIEIGKIIRTRITSKIILLEKIKLETITSTMNNKQKNQLFSNDTCISSDVKKTASENTDNGL